jgi:hypothetical protein
MYQDSDPYLADVRKVFLDFPEAVEVEALAPIRPPKPFEPRECRSAHDAADHAASEHSGRPTPTSAPTLVGNGRRSNPATDRCRFCAAL